MKISETQRLALIARATYTGTPDSQFSKGLRDASHALQAILDLHPEDMHALRRALEHFVKDGPRWDQGDYLDGHACVHDDVTAVLASDRDTVTELVALLARQQERGRE